MDLKAQARIEQIKQIFKKQPLTQKEWLAAEKKLQKESGIIAPIYAIDGEYLLNQRKINRKQESI